MSTFLELLINGISLGAIYALIALGFVVIFKTTEVVNFAHGSLLLLGAYVIADTKDRIGFWPAVLLGIAAAALAGLLIQFVLLGRLRTLNVMAPAILTIGVDIVLTAELTRRIGVDVLNIGDPWQNATVHIGSVTIAEARLVALVVALVLLAGFFLVFEYTTWGIGMRATAEDREAAALMGVPLTRVSLGAWLVAGALAAVAGVFLSTFPTPGVTNGTGLTALKAFPAAVLGGLDSTAGAVVGGLVIGISETMASGYQNHISFLGRGFSDVAPFIVMIAVLLWRPSGLFGTRELSRV